MTDVIVIIGFIITIVSVFLSSRLTKLKPDFVFSFKDTINIRNVPIITFKHNGKYINFIVDTGATRSIISKELLSDFNYKETEYKSTVTIAGGSELDTSEAIIVLEKNNYQFEETFMITELGQLIPGSDIVVHGLLGGTFLRKYRFMIDYKSLECNADI